MTRQVLVALTTGGRRRPLALAAILAEADQEGLLAPGTAQDGNTLRLVLASLTSGHLRDLPEEGLEEAIRRTQDFVRRAVGAQVTPVA